MQEADRDYIKMVDKQLTDWHRRETELVLWINKHGAAHADYEQKKRDLNNARWKIKQLTKRKSKDYARTRTYSEERSYSSDRN